MTKKYLKLTGVLLSVMSITLLSSCETQARYVGHDEWTGTVNEGSSEPSSGETEENGIKLTINFTYSSGTTYEIPSNTDVYIAGDWDNWTTPILTTIVNSNTVSYTFESLTASTYIKYSVYFVTSGTSVNMSNIGSYWLIDGSFSYDGVSTTITSTIEINDNTEPTCTLIFSIYYQEQLQKVPTGAGLYFSGDANNWGYDELTYNQQDGTYSVDIYQNLTADGTWYKYALLLAHTGNESELSSWTYTIWDTTDERNYITGNNLYFTVSDTSVTNIYISVYTYNTLSNILSNS